MTITLSANHEIVIPKEIIDEIGFKDGQAFDLVVVNGIITLVPDKPIAEMFGFLKGFDDDYMKDLREKEEFD
jgi:AbrB family looped-hinge helix DNA binding protein